MDIITIVNGMLEENCYLVCNGKSALIVDPGSEGDRIISEVKRNNLNVLGILITHSHFDHVGALKEVCSSFPDAVVIDYKSKKDQTIGLFKFKIMETFGHTMDSVSYYFYEDDILFTGDFVFKGTIGNFSYDMESEMVKSLNSFKYISSKVKVYPGHGESTTVGEEIKSNPFLRGI